MWTGPLIETEICGKFKSNKLFNKEFCEEIQVSSVCQDCKKKYCNNCFKALHVPKKLQSHKQIPILKMEIQFCSTHPKISADYFCFQDQIAICLKCAFSDSHKEHKPLVEVEEAFNIIQAELGKLDVSKQLKRIQQSIQIIEEKIFDKELFHEVEKIKFEEMEKKLKLSSEKLTNLKKSKYIFEDSKTYFENFEKI
jgi:hypothetical protein